MLRKFGFKKAEPKESEARLKLQKELFNYTRCVEHGFPHKPTAFAYDPKLKLFAIGTKSGAVKILGTPGVEFSSQHKEDVSVTKLYFLPDQGRVISLCSDNSVHLWELNVKQDGATVLEEVKQFAMEASKLKTISACCLSSNCEQLLMGTEGGNIHLLDISTFTLSEQIIYQDVVMQNVPDDFKVNPGAVEAIEPHPTDANKYLIGYNRGLVVLWDNKETNADQTYNATQQLESVSWHRDGTQFMSAHADGSYIIWATNDSTKPKEQANTPYGPFPCKAISKIQWKAAKADNFIVFAGGMPRPSYADRHTVSVTQGAKQVAFDFTSRVIDFVVLSTADGIDNFEGEYEDPHSLIVLTEEEMVGIDLQSEGWPTYKQPYLSSLHSSAITCAHHVANVPDQLWTKIHDAGNAQMSHYSPKDWPITGGKNNAAEATSKDLLMTGHEDGTVRFWDSSSTNMSIVYKLGTSAIFGCDFGSADANTEGEDEWPPFRKVGTFDPYSDDPRLGIQKIALCPISETLVIGGTAGQVVVLQFEREEREYEVKGVLVNIVSDRDNFVWKGHEALKVKEGELKSAAGFQPTSVMQLHPPAACTALSMHSEWQLLAAGTAHGFGLFDYAQKKEVTTKCTLNPNDLTGTGDSAMARRKSFKKSLRESFRRLRNRRSEHRKKARGKKDEKKEAAVVEEKKEETAATETPAVPAEAEATTEAAAPAAEGATAAETTTETPETKTETATPAAETPAPAPVPTDSPKSQATTEGTRTMERPVEARSAEDAMSSMVRFLYFADTFLISAQNHTPTLWAGTNAGTIFVFQITMPANDKRDTESVVCQLGKEIHLKHRAPVISICIIDRNAAPLPAPLEVEHSRAKAPDMTGNHQVVICSEEQFKIFSLPGLKHHNKFKLTAHEGSKVRKISYVSFRSRSDENYTENDLVVMTNQGDLLIYSIPHLRRQLKANTIRKENVSGIASCVFSNNGEGFYPESPSEFVRISLSARCQAKPCCEVELKEGMRPPPNEPEPTPAEEVAAEPDTSDAIAPATTEGGAAAEGDKTDEQAPAEGVNDSIGAGDISTMTQDSIRVHLSEGDSSFHKEVVASSVSMTRTVVTRTVVTQEGDEGARVVASQTTTTTSSSSDPPAVDAAAGDQ